MIHVSDLDFRYSDGDFRLRVPRLDIERAETVAFIGPSGSGKTTLLNLIAGIATPVAGRIEAGGVDVTSLGDRGRREFRVRTIGLVFQAFELLEHLSVLDELLLPYRISGALRLDDAVRDRARSLAERVGIGDKLRRRPGRLSQGERQRVAVCRAVLTGPSLLLADEPTGNLDPVNAGLVLDLLMELAAESGATLLTVTHDHDLLPRFGRVIDMRELAETLAGAGEAARSSDVLYLAWRYLAHHRFKTAILLASITLILFLPVGLRVIVEQGSQQLTARAEATPLVIGAKGSPLELVLGTLYFGEESPETIRYAEAARAAEDGLALAVPMHVRFRARGRPIVGTSLEYFEHRGLRLEQGRSMAMLGECVLGSEVARAEGLGPGDSITSTPETVFDLAGVYPLKMRVAGVLAPSDGPDDDAVFVDVKTVWIIAGLGHGHEDLSKPSAGQGVLAREGDTITANASVVEYNEITPANVASFHFHGSVADNPITAILVAPRNAKASAVLQGRYVGNNELVQVVEPRLVMDELLATVLTVQSFVVAGAVILGVATLGTAALVFMLSLRLRRGEIATLHKLGGSRWRVASIMASEVVVVLLGGVVLAAALTALTASVGSGLLRDLVRMWG